CCIEVGLTARQGQFPPGPVLIRRRGGSQHPLQAFLTDRIALDLSFSCSVEECVLLTGQGQLRVERLRRDDVQILKDRLPEGILRNQLRRLRTIDLEVPGRDCCCLLLRESREEKEQHR